MRHSEYNAHAYLAATPRAVRAARASASRVPTFGNVSRHAARFLGACCALVFLAGAL
jgi:hypothetical protein